MWSNLVKKWKTKQSKNICRCAPWQIKDRISERKTKQKPTNKNNQKWLTYFVGHQWSRKAPVAPLWSGSHPQSKHWTLQMTACHHLKHRGSVWLSRHNNKLLCALPLMRSWSPNYHLRTFLETPLFLNFIDLYFNGTAEPQSSLKLKG